MKKNQLKIKLITILLSCMTTSIAFSQGLSLPYSTGFDSPVEKAGWNEYRTGVLSTYDWGYVSSTSVSSPTSLFHDYNVGGNTTDTVVDWFVSPPMNFTSSANLSLKVRISGFSNPFPDSFEIWFGTKKPNPAHSNFVKIANLSYMQPKNVWLDTTINISFVTDSGYIALKYKTIGASWFTPGVDNIVVSLMTSIEEENNAGNSVINIFPNPFNSSATIRFTRVIKNADLSIYNVYGQKIKTFNNISGDQLKIERGNLNSGVYFYELKLDNKNISTGKLIITD